MPVLRANSDSNCAGPSILARSFLSIVARLFLALAISVATARQMAAMFLSRLRTPASRV